MALEFRPAAAAAAVSFGVSAAVRGYRMPAT